MTATDLTREQILAMPAGRELDLVVAWKLYQCPSSKVGEDFRPSTDIASAWQVFEKLCQSENQAEDADEGASSIWPCPDGWKCSIWNTDGSMCSGGPVFGETAPLAICRAALLATI